jgi:phenylacetate-CoA ligase
VLGRSDFMITIRGTNVYPTGVEAVVMDATGVSPHYELILDRASSGLEEMTVRVEADPSVPAEDYGSVGRQLERRLKSSFEVRIPVEVLTPGSLPRFELKAKRIIDRRPAAFRRALDR